MIFLREAIEERERKILAPYAIKAADTRGRKHPEPPAPDRTEYQRDRDRVIHTTAFRRLEYKTQVFVNHEGDYYRTRLTHTLEVAQVGRTIARVLGANEDLVEVICLAHDMGHTPFGHAGEHTLAHLMEAHGGFEHNQQTLRILTVLENRYASFPGVNLTIETLEGISGHKPRYRIPAGNYEFVRETGHPSLEAQIADAADSLAYNVHDVDDALYAGLFSPKALDGLALWEWVKEDLELRGEFSDLSRNKMTRRMTGNLVRDLCKATGERLTQLNPQSPEDIQRLEQGIIAYSPQMQQAVDELRHFLDTQMLQHYRVVRMVTKATRFMEQIFQEYMRLPRQLPPDIYERYERGEDSLARVVCDYVAGMTDRFALQEHQKLFSRFTRT